MIANWTILRWPLMGCLGVLVACGCAGTGSHEAKSEATMVGPDWTLHSQVVDDTATPLPSEVTITLHMDREHKVSGSSGCNSYNGTCTVNGKSLRFGPLATTKKFCADSMAVEEQYLAALRTASHFEIVDGNLSIHCGDGQTLVFHTTGE